MTNYNKVLNLLGIARRAGKIISGEGIVLNAIKNRKVNYLFIASDCGASTKKKFLDKSKFYEVPVNTGMLKDDLSEAIGMKRSIVAIEDKGFSKKFKELK
ncbi:L7Ae/L30e/S12e/Gadd45 family ribosomal protein [Fructilactobacillus fructivorans]|uniref:Ribosomal protein eL8/eL30/eS12/Gadd45 domain-containing protein n=1 Tax=Fructilactobacillus fructivorans TaxID=1614 RepID=A0AAE6P0G4_9LACO|nr:ribosomal L7Ae/L30e/S12e/Gadd45 family protein [Fructilactobacillus fructivorans]QFX92734.1 hypothetical protein LF543_03795 [Fructilactobacillus fructivorans]RDV65674.1 hypothetical protein DXU76_00615 [Fructilactobacillus fructivorans]